MIFNIYHSNIRITKILGYRLSTNECCSSEDKDNDGVTMASSEEHHLNEICHMNKH